MFINIHMCGGFMSHIWMSVLLVKNAPKGAHSLGIPNSKV